MLLCPSLSLAPPLLGPLVPPWQPFWLGLRSRSRPTKPEPVASLLPTLPVLPPMACSRTRALGCAIHSAVMPWHHLFYTETDTGTNAGGVVHLRRLQLHANFALLNTSR